MYMYRKPFSCQSLSRDNFLSPLIRAWQIKISSTCPAVHSILKITWNYNIHCTCIFYTFFWASEIKNHLPSQNLDFSRAAGQWICQALSLFYKLNVYYTSFNYPVKKKMFFFFLERETLITPSFHSSPIRAEMMWLNTFGLLHSRTIVQCTCIFYLIFIAYFGGEGL